MGRKPRAVQPWHSVSAAREELHKKLGVLVAESLLSSMQVDAAMVDAHVRQNRLRAYGEALGTASEALTKLEKLCAAFGFGDGRALELAKKKIEEVQARHSARTCPLKVAFGAVSYQLPPQLLNGRGYGDPLQATDEETVDTYRAQYATLGALAWFERNAVELRRSNTPRRPTGSLLFLCALALGLEKPINEVANSLDDSPVAAAQRRWKKRITDVGSRKLRAAKLVRQNTDDLGRPARQALAPAEARRRAVM